MGVETILPDINVLPFRLFILLAFERCERVDAAQTTGECGVRPLLQVIMFAA
jgi:hypothetical protein